MIASEYSEMTSESDTTVDYSVASRLETIQSVRVLTAVGPLIDPIGRVENPLQRKRGAAWHNDARNSMISEIAEGFAGRNMEVLWSHGLLLDHQEIPWPMPWPCSTTVLVEAPEHGRALARHLPTWELVHAIPGKRDSKDNDLLPEGDPMDHTIFTLVAARKLDLFCPDVLINAMGGNWAFDLPYFTPASKQPTLIIDIVDDFDEVARKAA